jgi:tetratricopeptide (TPR) repeat protein
MKRAKAASEEEGAPCLTTSWTTLRSLGIAADIRCHPARIAVRRRPDCEADISYYDGLSAVKSVMLDPVRWARTRNSLGTAYTDKCVGDRGASASMALNCFNQALEATSKAYDPIFWAEVMNNLGILYADYGQSLKLGEDHVELAIVSFQRALIVRKRVSNPKAWSETMNNVGIAYLKRPVSSARLNAELAVRCFRLSLRARTREADPVAWAETMENLGTAFLLLMPYDLEHNIESAIMCFEMCTKVKTRRADPHRWALITHKLAALYLCRIRGERRKNVDLAIKAYEQCIKFITRARNREIWALVMEKLGGLYMSRKSGPRRENLDAAIMYYKLSLKVRTFESSPSIWLETMKTLGALYLNRMSGDRTKNDEAAIRCFERCLQVNQTASDRAPGADVMKRLGDLYAIRSTGNADENMRNAKVYYNMSLSVLTRESDPVGWAEIMHSLGKLYVMSDEGEDGQNIELAINHYLDALKVRTRSTDSEEWATTNSHLGFAYMERKSGDAAQNIESAISCFERSLSVLTKDSDATEWAMANFKLGIAYTARSIQSQILNVEKGIYHFRQCLTVLTSDSCPSQWASATRMLGGAYFYRLVGGEEENQETSIEYYQHSLRICTRMEDPKQWGMIMHFLGVLYYHRQSGEETENIEWSIYYFKQAVSVRTIGDYPKQWASDTINLGLANMRRLAGSREGNLKSAMACFQKVLAACAPEHDPAQWLDLQMSLGICAICLGRRKEGYAMLRSAATAIEEQMATGQIRAPFILLERGYVSILGLLVLENLQAGDVRAGLEMSEKARMFQHRASMGLLGLDWSTNHMRRKGCESSFEELTRFFEGVPRRQAHWPMQEESMEKTKIEADLYEHVACLEQTSMNRMLKNTRARVAHALVTPFEIEKLFEALEDDTVAISFCCGPISYEGNEKRLLEGIHLFAIHNGVVAHRAFPRKQFDAFRISYQNRGARAGDNYASKLSELDIPHQELRVAVSEMLHRLPGVRQRESLKLVIAPDAKWWCAPLLFEEVENLTLKRRQEIPSLSNLDASSGSIHFTPCLTLYTQHRMRWKQPSFKPLKALSSVKSVGISGAGYGLFGSLAQSRPRNASGKSAYLTLPKRWYTPLDLPLGELRDCDLLTLVLPCSTILNSFSESVPSCTDTISSNYSLSHADNQDQAQFRAQEFISSFKLDNCRLACIVLSSDGNSQCSAISPNFALGTSLLLAGVEHVICTLWPVRQTTAALILYKLFHIMEAGETVRARNARITLSHSLQAAKTWFRDLPSHGAQATEIFQFGLTDSIAEAQSLDFADASDPCEWASFVLLGPTEKTGGIESERHGQCKVM